MDTRLPCPVRTSILAIVVIAAVLYSLTFVHLPGKAAGSYVVLAWNDLGMHCYNKDFSTLAVLPPYNTLWVQVIQPGDPPRVVTDGLTVEYSFPGNTTSAGNGTIPAKTNFWQYAQVLFGLASPLPPDVGLAGKGMSGDMDVDGDHFVAHGIPLTEFSDAAPSVAQPYQPARIIVRNAATGAEVARQEQVVAPVSSEMMCGYCHAQTGVVSTRYPALNPVANVEQNILKVHDHLEGGALWNRVTSSGNPILCAECHSTNALGAPGVAGVSSLSNAMHRSHDGAPFVSTPGCYDCHPGPVTRCLRDVMAEDEGMTCVDCHGGMTRVAQNVNPWLNEPRCDDCHPEGAKQDQALYRNSKGHSGVYCAGCHDSPHAIAPSREPIDGAKFVDLQGTRGGVTQCTVCHLTQPAAAFQHSFIRTSHLPFVPNQQVP